jgi:hypothetical protein
MKNVVVGIVLFLSLQSNAQGQIIRRRHAVGDEKPPKAILVELSTFQNKIKFLQQKGNTGGVVAVGTAAKKVDDAMMLDFANNFESCPVYFFLDTNAQKVREKKFKNVLMSADGRFVGDTTLVQYNIVYYGYPVPNDNNPAVKGLVVLDSAFDQMQAPYPYFTPTLKYSTLGGSAQYVYETDKYGIEYYPGAKKLSAALLRYFLPRKQKAPAKTNHFSYK